MIERVSLVFLSASSMNNYMQSILILGMPTLWITLLLVGSLRIGLRIIEIGSSISLSSLFRMTLICLSTILTKCLGGVFLTMREGVSFLFVLTF